MRKQIAVALLALSLAACGGGGGGSNNGSGGGSSSGGNTTTPSVQISADTSVRLGPSILSPRTAAEEVDRLIISTTGSAKRCTDVYVHNTASESEMLDLSVGIRSAELWDTAGSGRKLADGHVLNSRVIHFSMGDSSTSRTVEGNPLRFSVRLSYNDLTSGRHVGKRVRLGTGVGGYQGNLTAGTVNGLRCIDEATGHTVSRVDGSYEGPKYLVSRSKPVFSVPATASASEHSFTLTAFTNRLRSSYVTFRLANPVNGPTQWALYRDTATSGNLLANGNLDQGLEKAYVANYAATPVEISAESTRSFILVVSGGTPAASATRSFQVVDGGYFDVVESDSSTGMVAIGPLSEFLNVGLPSFISTYRY